jgi:DNA helicase II / ATP-dependent DNA helicase PcrA
MSFQTIRRPAPPVPPAPPALNAQQAAAAVHDDRPLLVVAGAGTGKTAMLAARVAHLVAAGADPQRLLLITFSRRAAQMLERRAGQMLLQTLGRPAGTAAPRLPWAGTFHSVGARLLREHAEALGLPQTFTIHDRADTEELLGWLREQLGLASTRQRFPLAGTCAAMLSRMHNRQATLAEVLAEAYPWCARWQAELTLLFESYEAEKMRQRVLDYDDLLRHWQRALTLPALAATVRARFDHVLVDELQDTNALQAAIVLALRPDGHGLTVVGDDAQSIYAFRGADPQLLRDFPGRFTPPAQLLRLECNYRSTQPILDAANAVIAEAGDLVPKQLWAATPGGTRPRLVTVDDEAAQAAWVADEVLRQRESGLALQRQAVLFRAGAHSLALELELARRGIPFVKYGGLRFVEAAHVRDLLALLRWADNPRHRLAGFRLLQRVPGIGPVHARRLLDAMDRAADPWAAWHGWAAPAAAEWREFAAAVDALRPPPADRAVDWPADLEIALGWLLPLLPRLYEDSAARASDLRQLQQLAASFRSRAEFLADLVLDPPQASGAEAGPPHLDEDQLILSTIHAAKGQEWTAVSVLDVVDGCLPSDMATGSVAGIEEERRLLYVAMTRARRHLNLLVPLRFHVTQQARFGDRHVYAPLSRFVTPAVAACCEAVAG